MRMKQPVLAEEEEESLVINYEEDPIKESDNTSQTSRTELSDQADILVSKQGIITNEIESILFSKGEETSTCFIMN